MEQKKRKSKPWNRRKGNRNHGTEENEIQKPWNRGSGMKKEGNMLWKRSMRHIFETTKGYRLRFGALLLAVLLGTATGALFPLPSGESWMKFFMKGGWKGFC